jgi:hypothetical protein
VSVTSAAGLPGSVTPGISRTAPTAAAIRPPMTVVAHRFYRTARSRPCSPACGRVQLGHVVRVVELLLVPRPLRVARDDARHQERHQARLGVILGQLRPGPASRPPLRATGCERATRTPAAFAAASVMSLSRALDMDDSRCRNGPPKARLKVSGARTRHDGGEGRCRGRRFALEEPKPQVRQAESFASTATEAVAEPRQGVKLSGLAERSALA